MQLLLFSIKKIHEPLMKNKFSRRKFLKGSALATGASLTAPMWLPRAVADGDSAGATYEIAPGSFQPT